MADMPVAILVRYRALQGRRDDLQAELEVLIQLVLQEPGCRGITLHLGVSQPDEILLYERWSDAATFWGPHSETPHLKAFISRAPTLLAGMPEITLWQSVSQVGPPFQCRLTPRCSGPHPGVRPGSAAELIRR